ncbi:hypothetical protein CB1_001026001 [Camelus ferus]|nr:hypothetical protein CB1_001026001 [Camelus ferus]
MPEELPRSHLGNVLVDMKLIDIKDTLPVGFIPIQETVDTQEVAFRKKRLCIKFIPRDSTEAAICDIRIMGRTKQAPPQYTFIGLSGLFQMPEAKVLSPSDHRASALPLFTRPIAFSGCPFPTLGSRPLEAVVSEAESSPPVELVFGKRETSIKPETVSETISVSEESEAERNGGSSAWGREGDMELNSMGIWYRMGRVPRNHDSSQPTTPSQSSAASTPAPNLPRHISLTLPATFRGRNSTRADYEYQHSNLYAISGGLQSGALVYQGEVANWCRLPAHTLNGEVVERSRAGAEEPARALVLPLAGPVMTFWI